jgi:nucleotide-binding universal stress UspA family protein
VNSFSTASITSRTTSHSIFKARLPSILVGTDGSATSSSAYTAADLIAARYGARVHVLSVLRPYPVIVPPLGNLSTASGINRTEAEVIEKTLRAQLANVSHAAEWTVETGVGAPASTLARTASDRSADIIIIGESHHGRFDRLLGEETSTQLARRVNLPLLVASPAMRRLPRRVVIAFGLTSSDFSGLPAALKILGSPSSLSCVHVQPRSEFLGVDWAEYDGEYRAEVEVTFERLKNALASFPGMHPELVVLHGDPVTELNGYAESVRAEMIVLGIKERGAGSFASGGGLAMKILRSSHRSVLLIPQAKATIKFEEAQYDSH